MPERSFGRTIRYRRTKLGLSQTKLGELVGRSASTIRDWERDRTRPNDPGVVAAVAAVLGIEERILFDKLDLKRPEMETSPTVEEVLAELAPEAEQPEGVETVPPPASDEETEPREPPRPDSAPATSSPEPAFTPGQAPQVLTLPPAAATDVSYLEDPRQRQLYRVRYLATAVAFVALIVALLWALDRGLEAFSAWWDAFIGTLRL
ncbi:MAG: helix-turn-helix domain-containing protein [Acidimicrobiia bacterium]